jgi:hypothetical protein
MSVEDGRGIEAHCETARFSHSATDERLRETVQTQAFYITALLLETFRESWCNA